MPDGSLYVSIRDRPELTWVHHEELGPVGGGEAGNQVEVESSVKGGGPPPAERNVNLGRGHLWPVKGLDENGWRVQGRAVGLEEALRSAFRGLLLSPLDRCNRRPLKAGTILERKRPSHTQCRRGLASAQSLAKKLGTGAGVPAGGQGPKGTGHSVGKTSGGLVTECRPAGHGRADVW